METLQKWSGVVALLAILLLIVMGSGKGSPLGGTTNYDQVDVSDGYQVDAVTVIDGTGNLTIGGTSGTSIDRINTGTCYIKAYATTIAASSTATVDCQGTAAVGSITGATSALTGVTMGDAVAVTLSTTTAGTLYMGLQVAGASASTTSGYITVRLTNMLGDTFTWPLTGAATGTMTYIVTDQ